MQKNKLNKKFWHLLFFVVLFSCSISLSHAETIKSASEYDYPPFCIVNSTGGADGFSIELLRAALNSVGKDVDFYVGPWLQIKEDLALGKIQVLPLVGRTPEREAVYDFTVPYISLYGGIFVREGTTGIFSLQDLKGKEIVVMKGDNAEEFVRRMNISDDIITTSTFEEAFKLLSSGKHDAVITQQFMGSRLLNSLEIKNVVVAAQLKGFKQDFTFAVKKGDKDLLAILNDGLSKIISDGTFDRIYSQWFNVSTESSTTDSLFDKYGFPLNPISRVRLFMDYDKELTESSLNYIETGEAFWKRDYDELGNKLGVLINLSKKEAEEKGDGRVKEIFDALEASNNILVEIELKAHNLVMSRQNVEALGLIQSEGYQIQKKTYSDLVLNYAHTLGLENVFEQEGETVRFAKESIRQKAFDVAKQIEIYLEAYPDKTLADLKNDQRFQDIAVQPVGKTGYTFVYDYENLINLFHKDPKFVGQNYTKLKDEPGREQWWAITGPTQYGMDAEGVYRWKESGGTWKDKYKYTRILKVRTADNVSLAISASTNLDEYEFTAQNEEKELTFEHFNSSIVKNVHFAKEQFYLLEKEDTNKLKSLIESFLQDETTKAEALKMERGSLYNKTWKAFTDNREVYRVTHLYYILPNGTVFLRMHEPERFGDYVSRASFKESAASGSWGEGLELGKTAFALRVVHPYYLGDKQIGYIEFGEEIDHFLPEIKKRLDLDNIELSVVVLKKYINKADWESVRKSKGLRDNYDDYEDFVLIDSTDPSGFVFQNINRHIINVSQISDDGELLETHKIGNRHFVHGGFALYDATHARVGAVITSQEITEFLGEENQINPISFGIIVLFTFGLIFLILLLIYILNRIGVIKLETNVLMVSSAVFFLVVIFLFIYLQWQSNESIKKAQIESKISQNTALIEKESLLIKNTFNYLIKDLNVLAIKSSEPDANSNEEAELLKLDYGGVDHISYASYRINRTGHIANMYPIEPNTLGADISSQEHMVEVKSTLKPVISDSFNAVEGFLGVTLHAPVINENGYDGTVAYLINLDKFSSQFFNDAPEFFQRIYLIDEKNMILYSINSSQIGKNFNNEVDLNSVLNDDSYIVISKDLDILNKRWRLLNIESKETLLEKLNKDLRFQNIIALLIILAVITLGVSFNILFSKALRDEVRIKTFEIKVMNEKLGQEVASRTREVEEKSKELEKLNVSLEDQVRKKTKELEEKLSKEEHSTKAMIYLLKRTKKLSDNLENKNVELMSQSEKLQAALEQLNSAKEVINAEKESVQKKVVARTQELNAEKTKVEDLLKQKTQFINQLSHDLRTPITPLKILLPIVKEKTVDPELRKHLEVCLNNTEYLNLLVTKTLDLARIDAGKLLFEPKKVNIKMLFSKIIAGKKVVLDQLGIKIINNVEASTIEIDELRISEVINNIIDNGKKYISGKGTITLSSVIKDKFCIISFKDTGIGMTQDTIAKLFTEFYKADSSRHDMQSFGLGLAISKKIVELHDGQIWVESQGLGKGSTFFVKLPIKNVKKNDKK